ncbi:MAG: hypothetical protein M3256_01705 [Actinomycetota bacterium]|nr:hypothetical protein [Actinomycetota bacterium]
MRNHMFRTVASVTIAAAATVGVLASPASASNTPPLPDAALVGTWVNTNANTRSVKQIVVERDRTGGITVDGFGACIPTLCEWGRVPAIVYGPNVSAKTGATFQTDQAFLINKTGEWSRTQLLATVRVAATGAKALTVRELTAFEDASGRHNFTVTETFVPGQGLPATTDGTSASGYPLGFPPSAEAGLAGTWTAPGNAVIKLEINLVFGSPLIHAFGACSPSACDMGTVKGITYGPTISATTGNVVLAPFSFGFKNEQLVIVYVRGTTPARDRLLVGNYNEFTDGSGRSNYVVNETFFRA